MFNLIVKVFQVNSATVSVSIKPSPYNLDWLTAMPREISPAEGVEKALLENLSQASSPRSSSPGREGAGGLENTWDLKESSP